MREYIGSDIHKREYVVAGKNLETIDV